MLDESILNTVKQLGGGVFPEDTDFDNDIIRYINSTFVVLRQLGAGPSSFRITDSTSKWSDWTDDENLIDMAADYISNKVRLKFDPPQSSTAIDLIKENVAELEWRIRLLAETSD